LRPWQSWIKAEGVDVVASVVITGGSGFLGTRLARVLLSDGELRLAGGAVETVSQATLMDRVPAAGDLAADPRVMVVTGDLTDVVGPGGEGRQALADADLIFHLAAAVSAECEADFDLGMRANLKATQTLLQACRELGRTPVVVFASSLAVFGRSDEHALPAVIDDETLPNPQSSYGTQKFICEQLLADFTRKGFLRGRAVRLLTVTVRPGKANAAASGFLSGIIREPLAGQRATCPVDPGTEAALVSPRKAVDALLRAATSSDGAWGGRTAVTLPALTMTIAEMVAALERVAGPQVSSLIDWIPDQEIARIVKSWPARVRADRATRLGLTPDEDFDSVIRMHISETGSAPGTIAPRH
jgi:D-erythronate 2-dehydrogenase